MRFASACWAIDAVLVTRPLSSFRFQRQHVYSRASNTLKGQLFINLMVPSYKRMFTTGGMCAFFISHKDAAAPPHSALHL
jgi:hypothetical protein